MSWSCIVGHRQRAYECPACAETAGAEPQPYGAWEWYWTRTASTRVRAAVAAEIERRWPSLNGAEEGP